MNIVSMGMPGYAYVDPTYYGTHGPADMAAWAFNYVFADGKMRALFTMLFGASIVLTAERAEAAEEMAAEVHYRRLFWLFAFGMIHAWLFWYGDILVPYAVAGALGFFLHRLEPRALWAAFFAFAAVQLLLYGSDYLRLTWLREAAFSPGAPASAITAWKSEVPGPELIARELKLYRASFADAFAARAPMTSFYQLVVLPKSLPEILGFITLGMLFFRNGFFTGGWSNGGYWRAIGLGYLVAAPLHLPLVRALGESGFEPAMIQLTNAAGYVLRPFVALAHAASMILLVKKGAARWLIGRLEAAGRMAFSNYLGTTFVTTTLFYGYGFGLFGTLSRADLYLVVIAVWALVLLWSNSWLGRYRYGPLEWLWRSLARGELQSMRRPLDAS